MEENENSPDPRRRLGKNLDNPDFEKQNSEDLEKGASNIDIKNRDATDSSNEETAPSGEMITNTGADILPKQKDADAASG